MSLSPTMKVTLLAAAAAAFFAGAAAVAVNPAKAADTYGSDRSSYGRYSDDNRFGNDADDDVRGAKHYRDGGFDKPRHGGWGGNRPPFRTVIAEGSYASDYLPYHVKEWRARRTAIAAWQSKVTDLYGPRFAHFRIAQDKIVDCDANRRGTVSCTVSAKPVRGYSGGWGGWRGASVND